jgi:hypothetical protein
MKQPVGQGSDKMRKTYLYFILFMLFFLPMEINAGTLENTDFQEYNIQMTYDNGQISHEPIYGQSTSEMHPNDTIIIENGVLKEKRK